LRQPCSHLAEFFTGPPYLWSGEKVGLTNAAALIGSILGTMLAGNVSDWFIIVAARRNKGIREPEHRLILLAVTAIITSGGLVMYGKGVEVGLHWICPVFGMGLMAFGFTASSIIGEVQNQIKIPEPCF
jgi:MFS family permease